MGANARYDASAEISWKGLGMDRYEDRWYYDDKETGGDHSITRWPVTIVLDCEPVMETVRDGDDTVHRIIHTRKLVEVSWIGEAEAYLEERGYKPAGNMAGGYSTAYTSDKGIARVVFIPAHLYEETSDRELRNAMDCEMQIREDLKKL